MKCRKKTVTPPLDQRIISSLVDESGNDLRIDLWLSKRFTYHSRTQWQELIKNNKILINNSSCRGSTKLKRGDEVTFVPDAKEPEVEKSFDIIFEDDYLLAVNKPGQLPSHPAGAYFKNTLWYLLSQKYQSVHFVNRLDRETSGLVLIAKDGEIAKFCASSIALKRYIVIVYGEFPSELCAKGFLYENIKISQQDMEKVRKKRYFSVKKPECKCESSKTLFRKLSYDGKLSILEADLITGRLHQIRATLCSLGFPVVGDKLYGLDESIFIRFINDNMTKDDCKKLIIPRQALHATQMIFTHPVTRKEINITAPLPEDMIARSFHEKLKNRV